MAFAQRIPAPLLVVACLPPVAAAHPQPPGLHAARCPAPSLPAVRSRDRIWRWCNRVLLHPLAPGHLLVRTGELTGVLIEVAREVQAQLVIIPSAELPTGTTLSALIERTPVSVLVAHETRPRSTLIIAPDRHTTRLPNQRPASQCGAVLGPEVTLVHLALPLGGTPGHVLGAERLRLPLPLAPTPPPGREGEGASLASVREDELQAILGEARGRKADLVVVGQSGHAWLGRVFGEPVARQVSDRTWPHLG
jgi:nucleotide-binding universal stress UspA family protein